MAELEEQLEFPKQLLGQFMNDYQRYGKYNLEVQVHHLEKLAGFYERRYKLTKHWTDCVKAHALYNSISARDLQSQLWKHRAFKVQQEYLADNCSIDFEQQQTLTSSLKDELESIRNQSRTDMLAADQLANCFDGAAATSEQNTNLFACMRDISMECSEKMASFAGRIIKECVQLLKPTKPPCGFEAAAIGSIARGEATPYSDLEFFFLVADKSEESVGYFERLAVTTYFQIANLEETKLSYMAIKELKGWFDDKAKNGFKIDGLSDQAGNIPTGNGSSNQHNHFIVTPNDLAKRYKKILQNPDKEKALRGDLTAMLSYIKLLYSHDANNKDLITELRKQTGELTVNKTRRKVNIEMLETDARKFNFKPNAELSLNGFAADVKREIYRFPSILLLDICIVTKTFATTSWESLRLLNERKLVSSQRDDNTLQLLLAAATYMRLSAYLYHDSQDERISVGQGMTETYKNLRNPDQSQKRWFAPAGLFIALCSNMIQLNAYLAEANNIEADLIDLAIDTDNPWAHVLTLFYLRRFNEALASLKQIYGDDLLDDPSSVIQQISLSKRKLETVDEIIIPFTLYCCKHYRAALVYLEHFTDDNINEMRWVIANCHNELGNHSKAVALLESITVKSGHDHYALGDAYLDMKNYEKSEQSYLLALEHWYCNINIEQQYDYYGNQIVSDVPAGITKISFTNLASPEERLASIVTGSNGVIGCVISLGMFYSGKGQFTLSNDYFLKALHLITELHGAGAAVPNAALTLLHLGSNYKAMEQYTKAEDYYKQALAVYRVLSQGADSSDIALTLNNLGNNYKAMGQYSDAEDYYKQVLAVYRELSQGADSRDIARTLYNLGINYKTMGEYIKAEDYYKQALAVYRELSQGSDSSDIARTLHNLGINYSKMGQYSEAEDYYKQALAVYREVSQGADSSDIAQTLYNLGINYNAMGQYSEAEDSYKQALAVYRQLTQGADSTDIANTLHNLGITYHAMGQYSDAEDYYKQALAVYIELSQGSDSSDIARTLDNLGIIYNAMGQYSEAEDNYKQALAVYRELSQGSDSSDIARTLDNLGINYNAMGQYSEAEDSYKQALAVYRVLSQGADSSDIARTLNNLGNNYKAMGQYSDAEDYYKQVLAVYRELSQGADSRDIARTLYNLGINYKTMGEYIKAEDYYKQALAVYRELSQGSDSSDIARTLHNLGINYSKMGQYSEAEDYYKQALAVYREVSQGADSSDIARTLYNLGINYNAMGQYSEAEDSYKQALAVYRQLTQGADSTDIANTLHNLGITYHAMGQYSDAEDYYKQALAVYIELSQGSDSSDIARTLDNLGINYNAMGQYSEAEDNYKQALAVYRELSQGSDSSDIARTLGNLGINYNAMGQYSEAEDSYKQALAVYRQLTQGADSSDIANTLTYLGRNYHEAGADSKAVGTYGEALDMYIRVEPDNPMISKIRDYLSSVTCRSSGGDNESTNNDSSDIADTLYNLGNNYKAMGQYSEAEDHYKQALVVYRELSHGADSSDIANTLCYLGYNYYEAGDKSKAVETYREALDMYIRVDPDNPMISKIRDYLSSFTCRSSAGGDNDFESSETTNQPTDSIYIANTLYNLGNNYRTMRQHNEAEDSYKQALAIYRNLSQGADSRDIADTLNNLGNNYRAAGDDSKAVETYREALDMYIRVDPDNLMISKIRDYLSSVTCRSSGGDNEDTNSVS